MSKDEKLINSLAAMNELDEALIAEALAPAKKRRPYWAYAAAALILILGAVFAVNRLLRAKEPDITVSSETQSPAATGEAAEPTAPPFEETEAPSEPAASALPTGTEQTDTPAPTEEATGVPTEEPSAEPSSEPTAQSSARPTATPAATPKATATPVPTALPTGGATPAPTARPTLTPKPTSLTTPRPTPSPTATPRPTSTPTPPPVEGTTEPEPSGTPVSATTPPEPEYLTYNSISAFVSAVKAHADPLLNGIDCYYYPVLIPEGAEFKSITVSDTDIELSFRTANSRFYRLIWYRYESPDYLDTVVNSSPGQWYGSVYVVDRPNEYAAINAWFTQYGTVFHAIVSWQCAIENAVSFCSVTKHTI